jgi:hypothetical protein
MSWINTKTIAAMIAAAALAGTATYLVQQREIKSLRANNADLAARLEKLMADKETAAATLQNRSDEAAQSRLDKTELLRLRNEVTQLRQQAESAKRTARLAPPAGTASATRSATPGYISRDQAAPVGYSTPEAALQTITWATLHGTPEQKAEGLSPELLGNAEAYRNFESGRSEGAAVLQGMQIMARKSVADNLVEMKLRLDADPIPGQPSGQIPMTILSLVKVGTEWKIATVPRNYDESWDKDGNIEISGQ